MKDLRVLEKLFILENVLLLFRQSLEERLLDCYIESCEGAPKDKVRDAVLILLKISSFPCF